MIYIKIENILKSKPVISVKLDISVTVVVISIELAMGSDVLIVVKVPVIVKGEELIVDVSSFMKSILNNFI